MMLTWYLILHAILIINLKSFYSVLHFLILSRREYHNKQEKSDLVHLKKAMSEVFIWLHKSKYRNQFDVF